MTSLLSCLHDKPITNRAVLMIPLLARKIHIDVNFSQTEYKLIEEAGQRLEEETRGRLQIMMVQDYNPDWWPYMPQDHWRLIKVMDNSPESAELDSVLNMHILGLCKYSNNAMYLVPERHKTIYSFMSVVEHEILHSIGLQHTNDPYGIMYQRIGESIPLTLQQSDKEEFCRVFQCQVSEIWK